MKTNFSKLRSLGQLFMTGINSTTLSESEKKFLEEEDIGGVILFSKNYESKNQLISLTNEIQKCRKEYPLFISVDQEGGRVQRFKHQFKKIPSMYELSLRESPKAIFECHQEIAIELKNCGVNLNFSPVCDIWSNPDNSVIGDRAFGKDAETVAHLVTGAIRGLQANGVLACSKHFPGHGDTLEDSHFFLPKVRVPLELIKQREFLPFIKAQKARVEFMMMSHVIVPEWNEKLPCTLIKESYESIRKDIKFSKIIITDDLEMKAIVDFGNLVEATEKALVAGADIVLFRNFETFKEVYLKIKEIYKLKKIKAELVDEKCQRIYECKIKHFSQYSPLPQMN